MTQNHGARCARCDRPFIFASSPFCQSCVRAMSEKPDNGTELEERTHAWQRKNIRR